MTSHGSAWAACGEIGLAGAGAAGAAVETGGAEGPGVFEAVESLAPHPATADATPIATAQITTADFTLGTVPKPGSSIGQAVRRVGQLAGTRLFD